MISRLGNDRLAICLKGTKPPGLLEFEVMIHSFASLRDMIQLMNKETQRSFRWAMVKNHVCSLGQRIPAAMLIEQFECSFWLGPSFEYQHLMSQNMKVFFLIHSKYHPFLRIVADTTYRDGKLVFQKYQS